jgi:hypothetical protein
MTKVREEECDDEETEYDSDRLHIANSDSSPNKPRISFVFPTARIMRPIHFDILIVQQLARVCSKRPARERQSTSGTGRPR